MQLRIKPASILPAFMVFAALSILLSLWLGYLWRSTPLILVLAAAGTYLLLKRWRFELPISRNAALLALIAFIMASYSLPLITPFYPASTDPAYLITIRSLNEQIPDTYEPYANIKFLYQLGHALFVRLFVDVFSAAGIPDFWVQWFSGALFVALELLLVFVLASRLFNSTAVGELSALFFLGARMPFLNMYWGAHPMVLGMLFVLLAMVLFHERNRMAYLFAPLAFICHPTAALSGIILLAAYLSLNHQRTRDAVWFLPALLLALPAFLTTYAVLASNILFPAAEAAAAASPLAAQTVVDTFYFLPLWAGLVPSALLLLSLVVAAPRKQKPNREQTMLLICMALLFAAYLLCSLTGVGAMAPRLTGMLAICAVAFSASVLYSAFTLPKHSAVLKSAVLLLILALFFSSSMLNTLRTGTQITPEEADAAFALLRHDPELGHALFLSPGRLKMAEFSNKIPFNPVGELFLPSPYQTVHDSGLQEVLNRDSEWKELCGCDYFRAETITRTGELRIDRIPELGVRYVVINRSNFPEALPWQRVMASGNIEIYSLNG